MILEIINLAATGVAIISTMLTATKLHRIQLKNKNTPPALPIVSSKKTIHPIKLEHEGTLPWSIYSSNAPNDGFRCPKCINRARNKKQYPICKCDMYPREHYHFKCKDCHYTNILRTADDT